MYKKFHGLSQTPFSLLPDADFLFPSAGHRRVVNLLDYGLSTQAGFMAITGDVGTGKTLAVRSFFVNRARPDITVGLIVNTGGTPGSLLCRVASVFGVRENERDITGLFDAFAEFLSEQRSKGKRAVLIIDEAQNLKPDMFEELRLLSNVNAGKEQLLQIVLAGQTEMLEILKQRELRQLAQRIAVCCHIDPLTPAETALYIRHRLAVAGGAPELFDNRACAAIHFFTGGVPRLVNLLGDLALTYSFADEQKQVSYETVREAALDRNRMGLSSFRAALKGKSKKSLPDNLRGILREMNEQDETIRVAS